jgi:uncharacterized protein (UPF0261 family)
MLDTEGNAFYNPAADKALIDNLKAGLSANVEVREMDMDINDPRFAQAMAKRMDDYVRTQPSQTTSAGG